MQLLDSISTLDPVSTATRAARAPRRGREPANKTLKFNRFRAGRDRRTPIRGAAVFSAGAGLALFDQILRGGPTAPSRSSPAACASASRSTPPNSCATLSRLREDAAALARRRTSFGRRRDEPGRSAASAVPALRVAARRASTRRSCARRAARAQGRSTPARCAPPRRPTRSWRRRGPAPPR